MSNPTNSVGQHPRAAVMGITPGVMSIDGPWIVEDKAGGRISLVETDHRIKYYPSGEKKEIRISWTESESNARVMADALNTMNAVGKLPSELAAENSALRDAVRELRRGYGRCALADFVTDTTPCAPDSKRLAELYETRRT